MDASGLALLARKWLEIQTRSAKSALNLPAEARGAAWTQVVVPTELAAALSRDIASKKMQKVSDSEALVVAQFRAICPKGWSRRLAGFEYKTGDAASLGAKIARQMPKCREYPVS
jgi:hypothetical protein